MKPHTKIYFKFFGYDVSDFIPCEVCNAKAVDIHHIDSRGMGGSKRKDVITNLMALCRTCHLHFGDKAQHMEMLMNRHIAKIQEMLNINNFEALEQLQHIQQSSMPPIAIESV